MFVVGLVVAGRRGDARAVASFVPDCLVLLQGLLRDPRVPRRAKALLAALIAYLALPFRQRSLDVLLRLASPRAA